MWDEIDIKKKTYFYFKFFLMKKIILLVIALVWLSGFGFAAPDYAQGCNNSWKVVDGEQTYNCQICTWQMYKTGSKKWAIQFYKECCPDWSTVYDTICCPSWQFPYDNNKKCCNWITYGDNNKKCCEKWVWIRKAEWDECVPCSSSEAKNMPDYTNYCSQDVSDCDSDKIYTDDEWLQKCCDWWMLVPDSQDSSKKVCIINTAWNLWINMSSGCLINWQCSYNIYKTLWIRQSDQNPKVSTFVQDIVLWITMFLWTVITIILITSWILYILAAILWKSNLADMAKKWIFNSILWLLLVTWSYAIVRLIQFVATAGWG